MKFEEEFEKFLLEYLENVKKELPESYRAQQLNGSAIEIQMVYEFETRFLKEPFMKVLKEKDEKITKAIDNAMHWFRDAEDYQIKGFMKELTKELKK